MLRHIPRNNFADSRRENGYLLPFSVDTTCPLCKRKVNFGLSWNSQKNHFVEYSNSHCPSCKAKVKFIYLTQHNEKANSYSGELFITPPGDTRLPLEGIHEIVNLPDNIKNAYYSAIEVLNAQVWTASAVMCRRVLEGITKSVVTDDLKNKPLAAQLKELPNHIDLKEPILNLADAIRKGGNLGAHFNEEKEPNAEISALMTDVLDYLIEYIYVLPTRIKNLHDKIENLSKSPDQNGG